MNYPEHSSLELLYLFKFLFQMHLFHLQLIILMLITMGTIFVSLSLPKCVTALMHEFRGLPKGRLVFLFNLACFVT